MKLTPAILATFFLGQIEIRNKRRGCIYHGEIRTVSIKNNIITFDFWWMARGEDCSPFPTKWVLDTSISNYEINLGELISAYLAVADEEVNKIYFYSSFLHEVIIIFPPNKSDFDLSKVEGLMLSSMVN